MYSIVIPAYNEEAFLGPTLDRLSEAMKTVSGHGEVILVDNNSTDGTARLAQERGARVVFEPINRISRARNAGARAAHGPHLIFLDADTLVSPRLIQQALSNLAAGDCCGGGALIRLDGDYGILARGAMGFWNRISTTLNLAAGSFMYCLKEGFEAVGGFSEKVYASEELWFSRELKKWGRKRRLAFRVVTDPPVVTSGRKFAWYSPLQMGALFALLTLFPFAVRFRALCFPWYRRPPTAKGGG